MAQIRKIATNQADLFANTEHISLISSFLPALLLGEYAAVDASDAAGMNLMNLESLVFIPLAVASDNFSNAYFSRTCSPGTRLFLRRWVCRILLKSLAPLFQRRRVSFCSDYFPVNISHGESVLGCVSSSMCRAYGFNPDCSVVAFSGDNPNSVAGLGLCAPGFPVFLSLQCTKNVSNCARRRCIEFGHQYNIVCNR